MNLKPWYEVVKPREDLREGKPNGTYTFMEYAHMKASIVDLRYRMNDVLKALERSEDVDILYHGRVWAF